MPNSDEITVMVAWYDPDVRGYGFCRRTGCRHIDGRDEIFLPKAAVGDLDVPRGATLRVTVAGDPSGKKSQVVREILSVDRSTALPPRPERLPLVATSVATGRLTRRSNSGFGFVDGGNGLDVYIPARLFTNSAMLGAKVGDLIEASIATGEGNRPIATMARIARKLEG
jgi:cold shock CspA family protein